MSGGSLKYAFGRIEDLANEVDRSATKPLHRGFAAHLRKVAKAARDLEWVLSGDTSGGSEDAAIRQVVSRTELADCQIVLLRAAIKDANSVLKQISKGRK